MRYLNVYLDIVISFPVLADQLLFLLLLILLFTFVDFSLDERAEFHLIKHRDYLRIAFAVELDHAFH